MSGTHSAPWGRKRRARDGTAQVVIGITVAAGKVWACEPENVLDLGCRAALRQELPGDPQIQDTPVRLRKALHDVPSLHPGLVDLRRLCCRQAWWRGSMRRSRDEVGWSAPSVGSHAGTGHWLADCNNPAAPRANPARACTIFTQGA